MLLGPVVGGGVDHDRSAGLSPDLRLCVLRLLPETPRHHRNAVGEVGEAEVGALPHELGAERAVAVVLASDRGKRHVDREGDVAVQSETALAHPGVQPAQLTGAL